METSVKPNLNIKIFIEISVFETKIFICLSTIAQANSSIRAFERPQWSKSMAWNCLRIQSGLYKLGPNVNAFALALNKSFAFYRSTAIEIVPQSLIQFTLSQMHIRFWYENSENDSYQFDIELRVESANRTFNSNADKIIGRPLQLRRHIHIKTHCVHWLHFSYLFRSIRMRSAETGIKNRFSKCKIVHIAVLFSLWIDFVWWLKCRRFTIYILHIYRANASGKYFLYKCM